jgi:predicted ATPase
MKRKPLASAALFDSAPAAQLPPFYSALSLNRESVDSFAEYPFNIPALRALDSIELHPKITFFVGENGSGKSTLLEAIAVNQGVNAEGGSPNFRFSTRESHSALHACIELEKPPKSRRVSDCFFLRAESFFNVATEIERIDKECDDPNITTPPLIDSFGGKSLHEQSHGESFFTLMDRRFRGDGFYLMDEPEAALSPSRQMTMLAVLHRHISDGSQFIIATHSPILMAYPDAFIYAFSEKGIQRIAYEETEQYRITRDFLNRREKMLKILLSDEE